MNRPMIDHRGPEFAAILAEITAGAKRVFKTKNDCCSSPARALAASSRRSRTWSRPAMRSSPPCAETSASDSQRSRLRTRQRGPPGVRVGPTSGSGRPEGRAAASPMAQVVLLTHNETSTGLTNPLRELAQTARSAERVVVVDGVSSISSIEIETDTWGVDVAVSGSQKADGPPGIALVSVSERAWAQQARLARRVSTSTGRKRRTGREGHDAFTPAVPVAFALQEGLRMLQEEGLNRSTSATSVWRARRRPACRRLVSSSSRRTDTVPTP